MTAWSERRRAADLEWRMQRDEAEAVACATCGAAPRESCRNTITGDETRFPAHPSRITAANKTKEN